MEYVSIAISFVALSLSVLTAWLTLLRKGKVKMTQPIPLLLSYEKGYAKISFFTMLYSSAFRGQIIENMHIVLRQNNVGHLFNNWVYAQDSQSYASGCYIRPEGIPQNHQFISSDDSMVFEPGTIVIEIYAHLPSSVRPSLLKSVSLNIPENQRQVCKDKTQGARFDWKFDQSNYGFVN